MAHYVNQSPTVSNVNNFKVLGLNKQSLQRHRDELLVELDSYKNNPSAIAMTETWFTENDNTSILKLDGPQPIESRVRTTSQ